MTTQETVTLTRAQVEELRAIIHNADSPLGNRLQDVSARLYFALDGAGWTPAPVAAPASVQQAIEQLVSALAESKGWMRDYARALIEDAIDRRHLEVAAPAPASEAVAWRWIIARETVINDVPDSRPMLGYTVFAEPFTTFETPEQASEALRDLKLPLGWVRMKTTQEPWASLFPATPTADDSVDAPVQQAGAVTDSQVMVDKLLDVVMAALGRTWLTGRESEEIRKLIRAALKGEQPAQPSGSQRGEV